MGQMTEEEKELVLFRTEDPLNNGFPALTTLLYRVCGNDPKRFEEATRLVKLFINEATK